MRNKNFLSSEKILPIEEEVRDIKYEVSLSVIPINTLLEYTEQSKAGHGTLTFGVLYKLSNNCFTLDIVDYEPLIILYS